MTAAGIPPPEDESRWELALEALKGVWASKYNDRAFYSLRKCGIDADDVRGWAGPRGLELHQGWVSKRVGHMQCTQNSYGISCTLKTQQHAQT
jgi:hypothetical protein